jgi:hypothetical protein
MRQAESPVFVVIRGPVRDRLGIFGDRKQMRPEFAEGHLGANWDTIVKYVQVVLLEVHNPFAVSILYIGFPDVPFLGYGPVEHCGSSWYL